MHHFLSYIREIWNGGGDKGLGEIVDERVAGWGEREEEGEREVEEWMGKESGRGRRGMT